MPSTIPTDSITFENNRTAKAVFPSAGDKPGNIVDALNLADHKAVLLVIGGADNIADSLKPRLTQLFGRGIARAAISVNAVIIDGGTKAGVMEMMGQGVADRGFNSQLIGVAPLGKVNYPGSKGSGETPLDPNHSHFVLVDGDTWGSETGRLFDLARALASKTRPMIALLTAGGETTKKEALLATRQNIPLIVVEGSGGLADEIATAWKARPSLPDDPIMAEIIADGRIEVFPLSSSVKSAERLILRELGGDNVLLQAWERFADYDLNAMLQQKRFHRQQKAILLLGLLVTALALINQVYNGNQQRLTFERWWPVIREGEVFNGPVAWTIVHYLLIASPIIVTVLITAAGRFKQGNKWLLLRAGAEAIKREIYRFRAKADAYAEQVAAPTATAPPTETTPTLPQPTPEQVLAKRVEDITRRVMRTEVNSSCLVPYDKNKGFPPTMYAAEGGDDGFSPLTPDQYVRLRLGDQLRYYRKKTLKLEWQLKWVQWSIFIVGGLGTFLAAISRQVWVALTTAIAGGLTAYLSYQQTESTLTKYNQAATDLENVKSWWTALTAEEQANSENVTALVNHTEQTLESELSGWVQQMQDALANLRDSQEPKKEVPGPEEDPSKPLAPANQPATEGAPPAEEATPAEGAPPAGEATPAEGEPPTEEATPVEGEPPAEGEPPTEGEPPAEGEPAPDEPGDN